MRAPLCFLCTLPVDGPGAPVFVNGERLHAHQECMAARLPSNHLDEREHMRRKAGGPKPVGRTHAEEIDGRTFKVTVLPEAKPPRGRTMKTHWKMPRGDA